MPETDLKSGISLSISDTWMMVVEKVYRLTAADGAIVAARDEQGACCIASKGEAPAVGSRLQPDSAFTRACFETGRVMFCEDAMADSRIQPAVAQALNLRSVVAVPIQTKASILGIIEVFASRPSAFNSTHVAALQDIADLLSRSPALGLTTGLKGYEGEERTGRRYVALLEKSSGWTSQRGIPSSALWPKPLQWFAAKLRIIQSRLSHWNYDALGAKKSRGGTQRSANPS